jgi:cellulose synthase/poly-beta-1,6-N-acetylglucosamine synthase-like glycosyltransferase
MIELVENLHHLAINGYILYSLVILGIYIYIALRVDDEFVPPQKVWYHYNRNPKVAIILPAYNEEVCIVESVRSAILQDYPNKQIIVVSDGSTDKTVELVKKEFGLSLHQTATKRLSERAKSSDLHTARIRNIYTNRNIVLIDSDNGGKASALNLGILFSDAEWILNVDADTVIVNHAISTTLQYLREDSDACSCFVGVLNGNEVRNGQVIKHEVPKHFLARLQWLEYIRSFILWRVAHDKRNATVVMPGAYTFMKRSVALEAGGYKHGYLSEDMEITLSVVEQGKRIQFIPEFLAWTEVPENYSSLSKQRMRWYRGALECLVKYRGLLFNWWSDGRHSYNAYLSFFVLPFLWIAEIIGIWVELFGLIAGLSLILVGHPSWGMLLFSYAVICLIYYFSVWLLLLFFKDRLREGERYLKLWRVIPTLLYESLCHHYINLYWMIRSHTEYYLRIKKGWNKFDRKGFIG